VSFSFSAVSQTKQRQQANVTNVRRKKPQHDGASRLPRIGGRRRGRKREGTKTVVLVPEGHVMTVAFAIGLSIQELKLHLASELRVPPEVLRIAIDVEDQQSLMDLGVLPHGSTRMEMSSVDPNTHPLRPVRPPEHDNMPDVITVRVHRGEENDFWEVVVEIQRPPQRKPFLGGYKHRLTGAVYHHASTQTLHRRRPDRVVEVFSRGAQTVKQAQPCGSDVRTQMTGMGSYVSCANDKVLIPGKYTTAAEYYDRRLNAVIRLQAVVRGWLAKEAVGILRQERDRRLAWLDLQERRRKQEKEEQLEDRRRRWLNPQRREDFSLHYNALKKWHKDEELKINAKLKGAERKAALCALFHQELEHIKNLGCRQILFEETNEDRCMRNLLEKAAAPHHWTSAKGERIEMDTANTIRARELRDLYDDVSKTTANQNERLQILMTLKHTVNEQDCPLTRDIVDLVDREVDLMPRLKASSLTGLRERIAMLFLQYIKTPAFNPAVAKLLKVKLCLRYHNHFSQYHTVFILSLCCSTVHRCKDCATNTPNSNRRRLYAFAVALTHSLWHFFPEVEDIRYLIDVIWSTCSALMTCSDIYNLVPWNCLLLAKEEVSTHLQIKDVEQVFFRVPAHLISTGFVTNHISIKEGVLCFFQSHSTSL
uniref:IQ motif and ubiquitin domain containing n=1 Tax=Neogobius melanostomus TaxID=47308 RepID=A0A8C6SSX9_9GOBI